MFHQTTEFCFFWWNFFHQRMMNDVVGRNATQECTRNFFSSLFCQDNPILEDGLTLSLFCASTCNVKCMTNHTEKMCCLFVCLHSWGHWDSDFTHKKQNRLIPPLISNISCCCILGHDEISCGLTTSPVNQRIYKKPPTLVSVTFFF